MSSPACVIRMATLWSGRKPEPVTRCPLAPIVGVPYECGAAGLCDTEVGMGRSYRAIGPARWSTLRLVVERRPEGGNTPSDTNGTLWAIIANLEYGQARLGCGRQEHQPVTSALVAA